MCVCVYVDVIIYILYICIHVHNYVLIVYCDYFMPCSTLACMRAVVRHVLLLLSMLLFLLLNKLSSFGRGVKFRLDKLLKQHLLLEIYLYSYMHNQISLYNFICVRVSIAVNLLWQVISCYYQLKVLKNLCRRLLILDWSYLTESYISLLNIHTYNNVALEAHVNKLRFIPNFNSNSLKIEFFKEISIELRGLWPGSYE